MDIQTEEIQKISFSSGIMAHKRNYYVLLRLKLLYAMIRKGKLSLKKVYNAVHSFFAYWLRSEKAAKYPFLINFELWNECNMNCLFCRTLEGDIYDYNPEGRGFIPKGKMDYELYTNIIDQVKDYLLMAVLYVNGEPLLYRDLYRAIQYASDRHIATMIASNGLLLHEKNSGKLLDSGLDFVKIAISGFTQKIYTTQHRRGDIERVKKNIETLAHLNKKGKYGLNIMLDYILYTYNLHELDMARQFCRELGIICNVRLGNLRGLSETEVLPEQKTMDEPASVVCDWPWKVMTVNWNGELFPCCDCILWSDTKPYARLEQGKDDIANIWNGEEVFKYRQIHLRKGRQAIPVCARCSRRGTAFKY